MVQYVESYILKTEVDSYPSLPWVLFCEGSSVLRSLHFLIHITIFIHSSQQEGEELVVMEGNWGGIVSTGKTI